MQEKNKGLRISEFLNKKQNRKFTIPGMVVGTLVIIYLVLSAIFSGPSKETIKMSKESERINTGLVDYLDGLPQTKYLQL